MDKSGLERKMRINDSYLRDIHDNYFSVWEKKVDADLKKNVYGGGHIIFEPPHDPSLGSLYKDMRTYIMMSSKRGNFTFDPANSYEVSLAKTLLLGKIEKLPTGSYRYKQASNY